MKDAYYFSHDANAQRDPKCSALISDFGYEGYGLYWALVEIMYEQGGKIKKFPKLMDGLARHFSVDKGKLTKLIEALLHEYGLLQEDASHLWSDRVLRNVEERLAKSDRRAGAGTLGGIKSGLTRRAKQNEALLQSNEAKRSKESKGKERKGNVFKAPTLEELIEFMGNKAQAQNCFDYYSSKGWTVGRSPMKDWHAAARRWMNNNYQSTASSNLTPAQQNVAKGLERLNERYNGSKPSADESRPVPQPSAHAVGGVSKPPHRA